MANTLSKVNISNSNTIQAWQVSQSVDAFTGISEYDITISGSLTITGSTKISGSLTITGSVEFNGFTNSTASWATNVSTIPTTIDSNLLPSGSIISPFPAKIIAGYGQINSGSTTTLLLLPPLIGKIIGINCFISVGISSSYTTGSLVHFPRVDSLAAGNLTFSTQTEM